MSGNLRFLVRLESALGLLIILSISSCQPMPSNNANSNSNANLSANSNTSSSNSDSSTTTSGVTINAREPEKYSATLVFSMETAGGDKAIGIPSLSIAVARNGDDRRVEFKLPDGTPLVYLDHNNHHYVIVPNRKQYAELTQDATGIQMHKLLTPGQLVEDLKGVKGVERAGDEVMNGRPAEKYRYGAATKTNTKAGEVKAEAFVYVDKETGLPLRAELSAESSGDVKGVKAAHVVAEMRDIKTDIAAAIFELPAGYAEVPKEKVREQIDALTGAVAAVIKAMMTNASQPAASASPAISGSPQ
jgi:hypothetical protein